VIAQREEARRRAAEQRRARAEAEKRRKALVARLRKAVLPALGVIGVFVLALVIMRPTPEVTDVIRVNQVEGEALAAGESFAYQTPTPTSGPYAPEAPICRVFTEPLSPEAAVAILRVGGVVLWYLPGDQAPVSALTEYAAAFESHVAVAPNPQIGAPIIATAWLRLKEYDTAAELVEDDFAGVYRMQRGEEGTCPQQG
jgi:hypothetical protein